MPIYKNEVKGTWYCSFYYTDWQGNRKKKKKEGFKRKKEAQEFEVDFVKQYAGSPEMTFGSLVELYMEDCKSRLKPTTLRQKNALIHAQIMPYFKNLPANEITVTTVRRWQNDLISHEKAYSQTYLKSIHNQLSAIFNFAVKYYGLTENPAAKCGAMGKKNAQEMHFWTLEEFKAFVFAIRDEKVAVVIFQLLFWTGMRSGELLALCRNDFDFMNRTVSITKNYARLLCQDLILEPKTPKSKRVVSLPDFLCDLLEEYFEGRKWKKMDERAFPITKHFLQKYMETGCEIAGIRRIRIHDLRHSHASLLIEMGFSPLLISERLGHENIETTLQTYSHLYPNKHGEVAEKLENLHKG